VGFLTLLAVHLQANYAIRRMADFRRARQRAAGRSLVEILAEIPRPALVLADLLQVAARHVQSDGIAKYVSSRVLGRDATSLLRDCDHHLGLVMQVRGLRRVMDVTPERDERMGGLDEEKRLLAPVATHFLLVLDVVSPDAKDAAHRKRIGRADDRQRRRGPDWNHVGHAFLSRKVGSGKNVARKEPELRF